MGIARGRQGRRFFTTEPRRARRTAEVWPTARRRPISPQSSRRTRRRREPGGRQWQQPRPGGPARRVGWEAPSGAERFLTDHRAHGAHGGRRKLANGTATTFTADERRWTRIVKSSSYVVRSYRRSSAVPFLAVALSFAVHLKCAVLRALRVLCGKEAVARTGRARARAR